MSTTHLHYHIRHLQSVFIIQTVPEWPYNELSVDADGGSLDNDCGRTSKPCADLGQVYCYVGQQVNPVQI